MKTKSEKLKVPTNHIKLQDGTDVLPGMTVYVKEKLEPGSTRDAQRNPDYYYEKNTGKSSLKFSKHKVTSVNEAMNSRSFVTRSAKGCEHSYTVKDTCVNTIFGSIKSVEKEHKEQTKRDTQKLFDVIQNSNRSLKKYIKDANTLEQKRRSAIRKLSKSKAHFCDC